MADAKPRSAEDFLATIKPIPQAMVDVIDRLIEQNFDTVSMQARVDKSELLAHLKALPEFNLDDANKYGWWNFLELYKAYGWKVEIGLPDQFDEKETYYIFKPVNARNKPSSVSRKK